MGEIPLAAILRHHRAKTPDSAPAVVQGDAKITWGELEAQANRRARLLASRGAKAGDFVTIALPNGLEFFETTFAVWKLGAIPNPVSWRLPAREFSAILDVVRPSVIVGADPQITLGQVTTVAAGEDASAFSPEPGEEPVAAYWKAMTSGGSTGRPKVIVDHKSAVFDPEAPVRFQPIHGVMINPGPLYHNAPFLSTHTALAVGCRVINMERFDAEETLRLIEAHRVSWVNFVPTMMNRIWRLPREVRESYDVSSLDVVFHMASMMPAWLKERWIEWLGPEKIWEVYGGTERQGTTLISGPEWLARRGSVGRVVNGGRAKIVDDDGGECGPGEVGEIYFLPPEGPGSTYHYLGAEPKRREGGWESIGDIGWMDEEGYLYLADRRTDMIVRGGANIYPAEVEAALDEHPEVLSSVVIGLPDEDLGQRVHAIIQPQAGSDAAICPARLTSFLEARLARYKLPESFEVVGVSLRDDAGKVRRSGLRDERIEWLSQGRDFRVPMRTPHPTSS